MAKLFDVGIFYKKFVTVGGDAYGSRPFLTKTLAKLVYLSSGKDVEAALNAVMAAGNIQGAKVYNTIEDYEADVADPNVDLTGVVCYVNEVHAAPTV